MGFRFYPLFGHTYALSNTAKCEIVCLNSSYINLVVRNEVTGQKPRNYPDIGKLCPNEWETASKWMPEFN